MILLPRSRRFVIGVSFSETFFLQFLLLLLCRPCRALAVCFPYTQGDAVPVPSVLREAELCQPFRLQRRLSARRSESSKLVPIKNVGAQRETIFKRSSHLFFGSSDEVSLVGCLLVTMWFMYVVLLFFYSES